MMYVELSQNKFMFVHGNEGTLMCFCWSSIAHRNKIYLTLIHTDFTFKYIFVQPPAGSLIAYHLKSLTSPVCNPPGKKIKW